MSEQGPRRRLAAILAADVVGYSRMMQQDEAGMLAVLKARRSQVLQPLVSKHHGRVVKLMGDGVLVEFASAVDAVACAVELQEAMGAANANLPEGRHILLRVGINLGDVIVEGSDLYGDGVNIAARLEALAEPGSVCASAKIRSEVVNRLAVTFMDLGEHRLKNMSDPVRVYRISPSSTPVGQSPGNHTTGAATRTSVAVLPFANMSGGAEQDYFADGITEDLITELSRNLQLSVTARNSTFVYKGRAVKVEDVRRDLGADFVVEGSVRHAGGRVRVTVQLIDAETSAHVWAERFDRDLEDIFAVQDEIVNQIVARLAFNLDDAAAGQRRRNPTKSATAYSHYLEARAAWRNGDEATARDHLLEAIRIDPKYGRALAYLAFFHSWSLWSGTSRVSEAEIERLARDYAQRAIAADKSDPFTLERVAMVYAELGECATAKGFVDAAAGQSPRDIQVMLTQGFVEILLGCHQRGLAMLERVHKLEPRVPPGYPLCLGLGRYQERNYEGALAAYSTIVDPKAYVYLFQVSALAQLGRLDEARRALDTARQIAPERLDPVSFIRRSASIFARPDDRNHLLEGYRKAGLEI
jgi:TolB-like protein